MPEGTFTMYQYRNHQINIECIFKSQFNQIIVKSYRSNDRKIHRLFLLIKRQIDHLNKLKTKVHQPQQRIDDSPESSLRKQFVKNNRKIDMVGCQSIAKLVKNKFITTKLQRQDELNLGLTITYIKEKLIQNVQLLKKILKFRYHKRFQNYLSNQHIKNIEGFFGDKKIKSTKLLYRASQNEFLASKFHEKCDNIPHTLTLVETQFGKIIGGYTPIIWNKVHNAYATDPQKRSFIFSLTNNQKLTINPKQNQQKQIECYQQYGPLFGGGNDIQIRNKANQDNRSYASIGYTYVHPNYIRNSQQSCKRFSGATTSSHFKIKQWQVYEIQFF